MSEGIRVLVCGGRDYENVAFVFGVLNHIHNRVGIKSIVHGAAPGADSIGEAWAKLKGVPALAFAANWEGYGKAAGPIRNGQMLSEAGPDMVVAFPGGRGTTNMIAQAKAKGVPVFEAKE